MKPANANRILNDQIRTLLYVWRNGPSLCTDIIDNAGLPTRTTTIHGMLKNGNLQWCKENHRIDLTDQGRARLAKWRDEYAPLMMLVLTAQRVRDREGNHEQARPVPECWHKPGGRKGVMGC